jgi:hypothetical protein
VKTKYPIDWFERELRPYAVLAIEVGAREPANLSSCQHCPCMATGTKTWLATWFLILELLQGLEEVECYTPISGMLFNSYWRWTQVTVKKARSRSMHCLLIVFGKVRRTISGQVQQFENGGEKYPQWYYNLRSYRGNFQQSSKSSHDFKETGTLRILKKHCVRAMILNKIKASFWNRFFC